MKPYFFLNTLNLDYAPKTLAVDVKDNLHQLSALEWSLNAVVFTLVYSIIPYYTGTQNTYFLHGLAQAGYGFLKYDWLVSTADFKPFFSFLVEVVYKLTDVYGFYVLYVLLIGIYINSIIHIINYVTHNFFRKNHFYRLSLLAILLFLHSSVLNFLIEKLTNVQIESVFPEGLARQTVIDHYFQSQTFGVLLFLSIVLLLKKKYHQSVISACLAALLHISYLMPAAFITLTCMAFIFFGEKNSLKTVKVGLLSIILVSPMLLYTFYTLVPISDQAKAILYDYRIPHHANPHFWPLSKTVVKVAFMLLAFWMIRKKKPLSILYGTLFTFSMVLTLIQIFTESKGLALMFPWRISVILLPLAVCLICAVLLKLLLSAFGQKILNDKAVTGLYVLIGLLAVGGCIISAQNFEADRKRDASLQEITHQMSLPLAKSFSILVPSDMEDYRLTTGLPIYVDYKSHPYRSHELEEWYERVQMNERFYNHQMNEQEIAGLLKYNNILYILAYKDLPYSRCYKKKYANQDYILYSVSLADPS